MRAAWALDASRAPVLTSVAPLRPTRGVTKRMPCNQPSPAPGNPHDGSAAFVLRVSQAEPVVWVRLAQARGLRSPVPLRAPVGPAPSMYDISVRCKALAVGDHDA